MAKEYFRKDALAVWNWLKRLNQYKSDYKVQQELIKKGVIPPYEVIGDKAKYQKCINKNSLQSKYGLVYYTDTENGILDKQNYFKRRWGFYPLANPKQKESPVGLKQFLCYLIGFDLKQVVQVQNISVMDYLLRSRGKRIPPMPSSLIIKVNHRYSNSVIFDQLKWWLDSIRAWHNIKIKNIYPQAVVEQYKLVTLKKIKTSDTTLFKKDLSKRILPNRESESARKRILRYEKRIKSMGHLI